MSFEFLLVTVIYTSKMLVTFHLSISFVVDADLRSMCGLLPGFGSHCTVCDFCECFGKSLYGRNLLLMIQNLFLLPQDIRFSTNEGVLSASVQRICRRFSKFAYVDVCVGGEMSAHFV